MAAYTYQGISGGKGRDQRPQFDALCKAATRREFDIVMAWSVDRLSRSVTDLCNFLTEIHALKIDLYLHSQGLDTSTPMGKAMFQIAGVFAELEREQTGERTLATMEHRARQGLRNGGRILGYDLDPAQKGVLKVNPDDPKLL